ncbi:peptidoglycan DD-metalloendopeptidase family protein [Candidatus Gracilibacteria bacterium]|nr:peptidoglycan DD-metalloendopeptidase family protein [Candidatus Gracilibacteria bacterium]MCF7856575.1 peptidoglycan DD-metalloendopeptidase family protein [Candidatus Gracilibacteria bacterium]MCF7896877.1 peptidoglycan DD-metalloendopeptidase family protein [Candidatus Gracilibacteria bacterium]
MESYWNHHKHFIKGFAITMAITLVVGVFGTQTGDFMASVLDLEKPAPFDGTALPIEKVPDWANLKNGESSLLAAQLPLDKIVALPNYDPIIFGTVVADLNWSIDKALANKLVTYAVPYMGSYENNSKEYEGSHLGVDIKIPIGTPVHAIANGKVVKVAQASGGFGKHIVIEHPDVPLLNGNETVTLYSAYAHLSEIAVENGQIVTRGELIGASGSTGTSTTPHLHFQIDRDNAPWHPWWPFSSAEASAAGLNFFDGVSAGLNQTQAIANTINPMLWVQRYLATDVVAIPAKMHASETTPIEEAVETEEEVAKITEIETPVATETVADTTGEIEIPAEVVEPEAEIAVEETTQPEDSTEVAEENQESMTNDQEPIEAIFTDLNSDHPNAKAIAYLKENEIVGGYTDGSFQPDKTVSRVEALKMILLGLNIELQPMLDLGFPDTSNQQWYASFVGTAVNKEIAKGYPDGTFGPGNTVNRAEYLKILLASARIAPDSATEKPYEDVAVDAWFAPFANYSKLKNIFPISGSLFSGTKGVTRAEVAETLYRLIVLRETGAASYSADLEI